MAAIASGDSPHTAPMAAREYTRNSRIQASGSVRGVALLRLAAATVDLPEHALPVVIGDYGCSSGRNSLLPIGAAVSELRQRTDQPIGVVHTDLADNDFSELFATLWQDPASYTSAAGVFPVAIGRSFYDRLLPAGSVTLGWSSWAVAWLSRPPAPVPDHVHVSYSADARARASYARRAARDWQDFLTARAAELRPGGRLVVVVPAADGDGGPGYRPLFDAAWAALTGLVREGLIDGDEAARMGMPHVGRSAADLTAPFGPDGEFEGLRIERLDAFTGTDEFFAEYQSHGDATAYGDAWAAVFAAGAFPSLATGLADGPEDPRADEVLRRLRDEVSARLAVSPRSMRIPIVNVVLAKGGGA